MKKLVLFFIFVFLLNICSLNAMDWIMEGKSTSSANFCDNTANSICYILLDMFNRTDDATVGDALTGQTWTEANAVTIANEQLHITGADPNAEITFGNHTLVTSEYEVNYSVAPVAANNDYVFFECIGNNDYGIFFKLWYETDGGFYYYDSTSLTDSNFNMNILTSYHFLITMDNINLNYSIIIRDENETEKFSVAGISYYIANDVPVRIDLKHNDPSSTVDYKNIMVYNGTTAPSSADVTAPVITFVYPVEKTTYNNYDGWFNFTTDENANCSVNTSWVDTGSTATDKHYYNSGTLPDGIHLLNTSCWDSSDNNGTSILNFTTDTTPPNITDTKSNIDKNNTIVITNISLQLNTSDNIKLFDINFTVDGAAVNYTDQINTTSYVWNYTLDISSYSEGNHSCRWEICDSHTDKGIDDYKYKKDITNKKITYEFGANSFSIEPKDKSKFTDVTTNKETDRYTITFTKKESYKDKETDYIVRSTGNIYIVGDELYTGWLVMPTTRNWFDAENPDNYKAKVKKIGDNEVHITTKASNFKSIGSLNCINHTAVLYKDYINTVTYTNIQNHSTYNYTRNLTVALNISCTEIGTTYLYTYINKTYYSNETLSCNNLSQIVTKYYQHGTENIFNISFKLNNTNIRDHNIEFGKETFRSDLNPPVISAINLNVLNGFVEPNATLNITCSDTISPILEINLTFNNTLMFLGNITSNSSIGNITTVANGFNILTGICSDFFSSVNSSVNDTVFTTTIILIDEKDNTYFDPTNLSSCKLYIDDNRSFYDFKGNTTARVNYTSTNYSKLRIELSYSTNVILSRYIDTALITGDIRVCANKEGITHYEQLILSAIEKEALLKNSFSNCYVTADYTRFAYQDSNLLKGHTIDSIYQLYTYDEGEQIILAGVDGSVSAYINIDNLQFRREGFDTTINRDTLNFEKSDTHEIKMYYKNLANNNAALALQITNLDDNVKVYNASDFADKNEFTLYFNYATLNVSNTTLFQAKITRTTTDGEEYSFKRYFNTAGSTGVYASGYAFIIAFFIMVFGLTFTATKVTFSWFGIIIMIMAIAFLSFAISTWYIILLQAIAVILMVYLFIVMMSQNYPTLA